MAQPQTWQAWVCEEVARAKHPQLQDDYQSGQSPEAPETFVEAHLVHYTEYPSAPIARINPDDEDCTDDEYQEDT